MGRLVFFALTGLALSACQETHFQETYLDLVSPSEAPAKIPAVKSFSEKAVKLTKKPVLTPDSTYREYILFLRTKPKEKADFLFMLDVSGSMDPHLEKVGKRLLPLFSSITDYDWQLALTLADNGDPDDETIKNKPMSQWQDNTDSKKPNFGKLMRWEAPPVRQADYSYKCSLLEERILTPQTPNYNEVFKASLSHFPGIASCVGGPFPLPPFHQLSTEQLLEAGRTGKLYRPLPPFHQHSVEQPLRALKSTMERVTFDNRDLFRKGVDFFSLIVTNGEERSQDRERATTAQDVKDTFDTYLKPLGKRFFHFSILVKDKECLKQNHEAVGYSIMELAEITTGPEGNISICEEDFGPAFQEISKLIETLVERSVDIPEPFIPETLKVEFLSGSPLPYRLLGNRMIFEKEPLENTKIKISFSVRSP